MQNPNSVGLAIARRRWLGAAALFPFWNSASAAAGELVIGQVSALTGPLGLNGRSNYLGASAVFQKINAEGGIHGSRIRFVAEDDEYKPELTVSGFKKVTQSDNPVLFINLFGSANTAALLKDKVLDGAGVAALGVTPGAESLRSPGSPLLFHLQAGDGAQLRRIVTHLATIGIRSLAVVYQDNTFGLSGLRFVDEHAISTGVAVLGRIPIPIGAEDLKGAAAQLRQTRAAAYVMVLAPNSGASLVRDVRPSGDKAPIYGMSYVPVASIVEKAGLEGAAGVVLAQVTPNAASDSTPLTRQFRTTLAQFAPAGTEATQLHLMGYLAGCVAVEALRRVGPAPNAMRVAAAMRGLKLDLSGYQVHFGTDNVGGDYVNLGVIDRRGRLVY
jgi:branched-chain amino acid transport system substrate-binding protein